MILIHTVRVILSSRDEYTCQSLTLIHSTFSWPWWADIRSLSSSFASNLPLTLSAMSCSLQHENITHLSPLLERLCNVVFYSPNPINDIWIAFDILLPAITDKNPLPVDMMLVSLLHRRKQAHTLSNLHKSLSCVSVKCEAECMCKLRSFHAKTQVV